jgi:hypothetical protein
MIRMDSGVGHAHSSAALMIGAVHQGRFGEGKRPVGPVHLPVSSPLRFVHDYRPDR